MSSTYIEVAGSAREPLRRFLQQSGTDRFIVLTDANVYGRAAQLTARLPGNAGVFPVALGERRKTLRTLENVLELLVKNGVDRSTTVLGVGGGVAGDLFGFAASVYMRGVPYVHVATTLVSMVDAAIGGKTGVDLPSGKNLAGTFREPAAVFAWVDTLQTLPYRHLREGLSEVVKHAIIEGGELFDAIEALSAHEFWRWPWESLVQRAQQVKIGIVARDRTELGVREVLNLGHTFAHAIEHASAYRVTHGAGVSIGLRAAGLLAMRTGRFSPDDHLRVLTVLALLRLPAVTRTDPDAIRLAMNADKKRRRGELRFVLPRAIGNVEYGVSVSERALCAVLHTLREPPGDSEFR